MKKILILATYLILIISCKPENPKFIECNDLLSPCKDNQEGEYCLFGIKWGEKQEFAPNGIDANGPQLSGGMITYSFHTEVKLVSNHKTDDLETISFDSKGQCAREKAQQALAEWAKYGNFSFLQEEDNSLSNIQFIAARDLDVNTGNPNYQDRLCSGLGGRIILKASKIQNCNRFYILCLHEIGHVLGLGHVSSRNVMSPGSIIYSLSGLQEGDIRGIIEIYGEK